MVGRLVLLPHVSPLGRIVNGPEHAKVYTMAKIEHPHQAIKRLFDDVNPSHVKCFAARSSTTFLLLSGLELT